MDNCLVFICFCSLVFVLALFHALARVPFRSHVLAFSLSLSHRVSTNTAWPFARFHSSRLSFRTCFYFMTICQVAIIIGMARASVCGTMLCYIDPCYNPCNDYTVFQLVRCRYA